MRDIILQIFALSLDGVIQTDGTAFEEYFAKLPDDPDHERWIVSSIANASLHAVGRNTYEAMSKYFPTVTHEDGANPLTTSAIDEAMNRIPKVVFSSSLQAATWGDTTILRGDTLAELDRLRKGGDGYVLVHGGATFARALARLDAVDEYRLVVCPYVAGSGPRLFTKGVTPRELELVSCDRYLSGVFQLTLRRTR